MKSTMTLIRCMQWGVKVRRFTVAQHTKITPYITLPFEWHSNAIRPWHSRHIRDSIFIRAIRMHSNASWSHIREHSNIRGVKRSRNLFEWHSFNNAGVYVYVCIYIYMYMYVCMCMYVCVYIYMYICVYVFIYTYNVCVYLFECLCMHIRV